jgi:hypothetical protein
MYLSRNPWKYLGKKNKKKVLSLLYYLDIKFNLKCKGIFSLEIAYFH